MRFANKLAPLVLIFALTGCQTLREFLGFGYSDPKVELSDIEIRGISLTAIDALVSLKVMNPNSFDIKLARMDYDIVVAGLQVADGIYEKPINIESEKETVVKLPLRLDKNNVVNIISRFVERPKEEMLAVISAKVVFDSPVGQIEHTFVDEKKIKAK